MGTGYLASKTVDEVATVVDHTLQHNRKKKRALN